MWAKDIRKLAQGDPFDIAFPAFELGMDMWRERQLQPVAVKRALDGAGIAAEVEPVHAQEMKARGRGGLMATHAGLGVQTFEQTRAGLHELWRLQRHCSRRDDRSCGCPSGCADLVDQRRPGHRQPAGGGSRARPDPGS